MADGSDSEMDLSDERLAGSQVTEISEGKAILFYFFIYFASLLPLFVEVSEKLYCLVRITKG